MGRDRPRMLGPCTRKDACMNSGCDKARGVHSLYGTQHAHAANMRVLAIHMISKDDNLENVRVNRFAARTDRISKGQRTAN